MQENNNYFVTLNCVSPVSQPLHNNLFSLDYSRPCMHAFVVLSVWLFTTIDTMTVALGSLFHHGLVSALLSTEIPFEAVGGPPVMLLTTVCVASHCRNMRLHVYSASEGTSVARTTLI